MKVRLMIFSLVALPLLAWWALGTEAIGPTNTETGVLLTLAALCILPRPVA